MFCSRVMVAYLWIKLLNRTLGEQIISYEVWFVIQEDV